MCQCASSAELVVYLYFWDGDGNLSCYIWRLKNNREASFNRHLGLLIQRKASAPAGRRLPIRACPPDRRQLKGCCRKTKHVFYSSHLNFLELCLSQIEPYFGSFSTPSNWNSKLQISNFRFVGIFLENGRRCGSERLVVLQLRMASTGEGGERGGEGSRSRQQYRVKGTCHTGGYMKDLHILESFYQLKSITWKKIKIPEFPMRELFQGILPRDSRIMIRMMRLVKVKVKVLGRLKIRRR